MSHFRDGLLVLQSVPLDNTLRLVSRMVMLISLLHSPPIYLFSGYSYADVFFFCFFFSDSACIIWNDLTRAMSS